ncbi:MAG: tetratricopeptide repeat protein [Treponema sp.]|nr:tetratricopeptide repeat protein [Treponema sp.]
MKKTIVTVSLIFGLAMGPAFCDDILQSLNKLNAAKLLVEDGNKNLSSIPDSLKSNALTALDILKSIEIQKDAENFEKTYFAVLAKTNLILQKYDDVKKIRKQAESAGENALSEELDYYTALAYFQTGDYEKCISLMENKNNLILAQAYFKSEKYSEACKVYEKLNKEKKLSEDSKLDYARALYRTKQYEKAAAMADGNSSDEALLILGGCALSGKKYSAAAEYYGKVKNNSEALYLKAYAEFKDGKYVEAGKDFEAAGSWQYATQSYLLSENYSKAEKCAEKNLEKSITDESIEKSVMLLGDIYSDQKKYDKAISLYNKYSKQGKAWSVKCLYKIAVCKANAGDIAGASEAYAEVYKKYPVAKESEEALFRSGDVLYMAGLYTPASSKLKNYSDTFTKGEYTNLALYYEFDSYVKTNEKPKAILTGNKIVSKYSESEFLNAVLEKLYELNYEREDFNAALTAAEKLAERTGHKDASLEKKISYLKKILGGGNRELILAEADFENAGGKATVEGRDKGTVYAKLLVSDSETKAAGVKLAGELLAIQEKNIVNERESAAANALIMAEYFYEQNRKAEAAEKYLKAAEYSRMNGDGDLAAFSLYTATECFVHLGKRGDANETASLLKQLYPESKYTNAVRSLLK